MTKPEFIRAAFLAALPSVADRIIKISYPELKDNEIADRITSLTADIAEKSYKEMVNYLQSESVK